MKLIRVLSSVMIISLTLTAIGALGLTTQAQVIPSQEIFYSNDYNTSKTSYEVNSVGSAEISNGVLKVMASNNGINNFQIKVPAAAIPGKPKLVMQYRIKPVGITGSVPFIESDKSYGVDNVVIYNGQIRASSISDTVIQSYTSGTWYTITIVYDNAVEKRDIYINGQYKGQYDNKCNSSMSYAQTGAFNCSIYLKGAGTDGTKYYELDDFMLYKYPDTLDFEIQNSNAVSPDALELEFNMIPDAEKIIPANFQVPGATVSNVVQDTINPRKYKVFFQPRLQNFTNYTLTVSNVTGFNGALTEQTKNLSFTTGYYEAVYAPANSIYYEDFEGKPLGVLSSLSGSYLFNVGQYDIINDGNNKIMRMKQMANDPVGYPLWRIQITKDKFASASKIILEYRVRLNITYAYGSLRTRSGEIYGTYLPFFYGGDIYDKQNANIIGTYANNEWITITSVHDVMPDSNGKARRDTYINGVFAGTSLDDYDSSTNAYLNRNGNFFFNFSITTNNDPNQYADIDYIKVYTEPESFGLQLPNTTAVDTEKIDVVLNNVPNLADLTSKVEIRDETGKVSGISSTIFNTDSNVGTKYAQKYTLYFDTPLDFGKEYALIFNQLADVNGRTIYAEYPIQTRLAKIYANDFILYGEEGEEYTLKDGTFDVSFHVKNESYENLTPILVAALYDSENKMTNLFTKEFDLPLKSDFQHMEPLVLSDTLNKRLDLFIIKGAEKPFPISGVAVYNFSGKLPDEYEPVKAIYKEDAEINCSINNDIQVITVNVNTKAPSFNRETVLFVLKENKTFEEVNWYNPMESFLYVGFKNLIGENDAFQFKIPDVKGKYGVNLFIGLSEKRAEDFFDFQGVAFIVQGMNSINAANTIENVESFLNDYKDAFGLDLTEYNRLGNAGKTCVLSSIISLRNEKLSKQFANSQELLQAWDAAILMGKIANGDNLIPLFSELPLEENAFELYNNLISEGAKTHLISQLQNRDYQTPTVFSDAFTLQVVISGIYKAENYTQTEEILKILKEKIGLDFSDYNTLINKSLVLTELSGKLYNSYSDINNKFKECVRNQQSKDNNPKKTVNASGGGFGAVSFSKPEETINSDKETPVNHEQVFQDLNGFEWANKAVLFLAENKIIRGKADGLFAPEDFITRAEFIKMVTEAFKLEISPDVNKASFSDVDTNDWYYTAVQAGFQHNIISGVSEDSFSPNSFITREMAAVILYRTAQFKGINFQGEKKNFKDIETIEDYAYEAVVRLSGANLISGFDTGCFMPKDLCNRAQGAQLIYNLLKKLK